MTPRFTTFLLCFLFVVLCLIGGAIVILTPSDQRAWTIHHGDQTYHHATKLQDGPGGSLSFRDWPDVHGRETYIRGDWTAEEETRHVIHYWWSDSWRLVEPGQ